MPDSDRPVTRLIEGETPPAPGTPLPPEEKPPLTSYILPTTLGLGAGAGILAAAVAWGAPEAAVGVLTAYIVYNIVAGRTGANDFVLSGISRIATSLRPPRGVPREELRRVR